MVSYYILPKIYEKYVINLKNVKGVNKIVEVFACIYPVSVCRR